MSGRVFKWAVPIRPHQEGYVPMREAIRKALIEQDTNPKALCDELGLNRFFVYNYLTGEKNEIEATKAAVVLKHLGLPLELLTGETTTPARRKAIVVESPQPLMLLGVAETGSWREPQTERPCDVLPVPGYAAQDQRALIVSGSDMLPTAAPGDFLVVLTREPPITEGSFVILKKTRSGLVEYGVYRAHLVGDEIELWPVALASKGAFAPIKAMAADVFGVVLRVVKPPA